MHIHFVGIGGIGVSALARHFHVNGNIVTGSDLSESEITTALKDLGIKIYKGHKENNISPDVKKLIYSPAVPNDNSELVKAKKQGIDIKSYPEALGEITKNYFTITVSGTHGKSTTTSMAALMMEKAGLDPTVIVGTKLEEFGNSNYRNGESKYLLIEADEWQGSLLNYSSNLAIILNLELEHLDFYKDIEHLIKTFQDFVDKIDGNLILNKKDKNLKKLTYTKDPHYFSSNMKDSEKIKKALNVPGVHNLENAAAVFKLGEVLGVSEKKILEGLSRYKGSWRRFQEKTIQTEIGEIDIVLDYAHHPTELKATLQAAREKYEKRDIVAVFQPHQYQRSMHLKDQFVQAFEENPIDRLLVTDIYSVPGREEEWIVNSISSKELVSKTTKENVEWVSGNLNQIAQKLTKSLQGDELIVIIGAGDIYKLEEVLRG